MKTMNAFVIPKFNKKNSGIKQLELPTLKDNELLIKVNYAPVTPTDLTATKDSSFMEKVFSMIISPKRGVYGEMYSGVVEQVGKSVTGFHINDRVYGSNGMKMNAYAEYVIVKDKTLIRKVPDTVKEDQVLSLLDGGITALPYLRDTAEVKENQKILIIGASGAVGSMAVQIAKYYNLEVTGVAGSSNQELLTDLGCDHVIDYTMTDYLNRDVQYDVIFDAVGKSTYKDCYNILKEEGRYMTSVPTVGMLFGAIFKKKQTGKQKLFSATGLRKIHLKHKDLELLEQLLENKTITPFIEKVYPLSELLEAQDHVRSGHKKGNILVNTHYKKANQ